MNQFLNNPMALAGLAVMQGGNVADSLIAGQKQAYAMQEQQRQQAQRDALKNIDLNNPEAIQQIMRIDPKLGIELMQQQRLLREQQMNEQLLSGEGMLGADTGIEQAYVMAESDNPILAGRGKAMIAEYERQAMPTQKYQEAAAKKQAEIDIAKPEKMAKLEAVQATIQYNKALAKDIPSDKFGIIAGNIGQYYDPQIQSLKSGSNQLALQARTLLELPASGFSDADREFLVKMSGEPTMEKEAYMEALNRLEGMLQSSMKKLNGGTSETMNNTTALRQQANEAIRAGVDPLAVAEKFQEMTGEAL